MHEQLFMQEFDVFSFLFLEFLKLFIEKNVIVSSKIIDR